MSRTNLTAAPKAGWRGLRSGRVLALTAAVVPALAAGAVWLNGSTRSADVTYAAASPARSQPVESGPVESSPAATAATPVSQSIPGSVGAIDVAVPEELQMFVVATITADGRVVPGHPTGPKTAPAKGRAGAKGKTDGAKEARNRR